MLRSQYRSSLKIQHVQGLANHRMSAVRIASWMLVGFAAIALLACERAHDDARTVERPIPKISLRMIDRGAEPRALLRGHPRSGAHARYKLTYELDTQSPPKTVRSWATFDGTVELEGDVIHTRERVLDADGAGRKAVGRVQDAWRDARGAYVRAPLITMKPGDSIADDAIQPELATIAPDEAVGVGGRWHEDIVVGDHTASCEVELVSRDGDHARQRVTYHVTGPQWGYPATRDGTAMEELDLGGVEQSLHATDTIEVKLPDRALPGRATLVTDIVVVP